MTTTYVPLNDAQLKNLHSKQPKQASLISAEYIRSRIADVTFQDVHAPDGTLNCMVCLLRLDNGFEALGKAFVMDPENHVRELSEHYAYQDAFNQLWGPIAFSLKEKLYDPQV